MLNLFIAILFASMMGEYFYISTRVETIDYALDNLPLGLIQRGVYLLSETPTFDEEKLQQSLDQYFMSTLKNYYENESFSYELEYYTSSSDEVCTSECDKVVINVTAKVSVLYTYERAMYYEITGGK